MKGASNMGALKVEVRSTKTGNTQELWSQSGNQGDQWTSMTISLDVFVGESLTISFVASKGSTWQGDIAIDDVMLSSSPLASTTALTSVTTTVTSAAATTTITTAVPTTS